MGWSGGFGSHDRTFAEKGVTPMECADVSFGRLRQSASVVKKILTPHGGGAPMGKNERYIEGRIRS
jgi:hypothetical protein